MAGLAGLLFLLLGIGFMTFPDILATAFFVQPATVQGLNAIRGDFGGLFLGMSFFCLLGTATGRRRWLIVPVIFLIFIIAGRLLSQCMDGFSAAGAQSLIIEILLLVLLVASILVSSLKTGSSKNDFNISELLNLKVMAAAMVVVVIIAGLLLLQKKIGLLLVGPIGTEIMSADVIGSLPDGLHVALLGTGAPLADPRRASFSVGVIAGKDLYVVDVGPGSVRKLELMKFRHAGIKAILLTHFHSDHIGDLGELMLKRWSGGSMKSPLDVFGPKGVETVVAGFNTAYSLDFKSRILHHGPNVVPPSGAGGLARPFSIPPGAEATTIIDVDGLRVTAFTADHGPVKPAVGYRFDYRGRTVVISGDTVSTPALYHHARGADLLLMDALQPAMIRSLQDAAQKTGRTGAAAIFHDIRGYHASPEDGAIIANAAGVRQLILTHILPPLPVAEFKPAFLGESKKFFSGPITIGEDGMFFILPAGGKDILTKWLL
jgi:ribonuclease Z